uniref:Ig-like domain-containing protein n=1 Tax=Branchiostoma floridae TaxID=7739 RepID=C3Y4M9_BRAFL|eukprot:XP_002608676.1 hypothetical protein BRAFLDRAFT_73898 [Branchiostoma floridae]
MVWSCLLVLLATTTVLGEDKNETFNIYAKEGEDVILNNCTSQDQDVIWTYKKPGAASYTPQSCPQECDNRCQGRDDVIDLPAVSRTCGGSYQYVSSGDDAGIRWKCTYHLQVHYFPLPVNINNPTPAVFENDRVALTCQTDDLGNPPASFTSPDFPPTSGSEPSTTLIIESASRDDNGTIFTCTLEYEGQDQNGEAFTRTYEETTSLIVYYLPREVTIKVHNNNATLEEGDNVILECVFGDSYPRPSVTWWKNGRKLPGETSTTLELRSLKVVDKGDYMCETTVNALGQERSKKSTAVFLNVTGTPNTGTGVAGVLLLVVIAIASVICIRQKRRNPDRGGDTESLETPSEPSMQVSTLSPSSLPYDTSSSVEPRSDTTPKRAPSDLSLTNEKLPYHRHESSNNDLSQVTRSTDMSPTSEKLLYQKQDSSSGGYPKTVTSTEGGDRTSFSLSSNLDNCTNPKLTDSSDPLSLQSHSSLPDNLNVADMISIDSDNTSRQTDSSPNLLDNGASNITGVPADSNNLNKPVNKPQPDKSSAIKNLSESSESMEESIVLVGGGGTDQQDAPPMNEDVDSLREKGDEVAITIDMMLKKTQLKTDHLGIPFSKLTELYVNLSYAGLNDWKMFADKLGPTHGTPSSNTGTNALLTTIDLVIIGSAAFVVMVIILVVTALFCFWKRRESRDRAQALQANGSFHLVPSHPTDDVMAPGSDRGNLDGEEFEPQPPPYSRVNPDPRFPTTQTCPWADGACHLPLVTHYQSPGTTLTPNEDPNNGTNPPAPALVPSTSEGTRPKKTGDGPIYGGRSMEDSSIPDKPGSLRSHPEIHVPRPLPANLTIGDMISEGS